MTLSLMKAADYPEKAQLTNRVADCINSAIHELETALSSAPAEIPRDA